MLEVAKIIAAVILIESPNTRRGENAALDAIVEKAITFLNKIFD